MAKTNKLTKIMLNEIINEEKQKLGLINDLEKLPNLLEHIASLTEQAEIYEKKLMLIQKRKKQLCEVVKKLQNVR